MRNRVVITGMSAITPIGTGLEKFWDALVNGRSGTAPITLFDASPYPCRIAAEVKDFEPSDFFERKKARQLARATQFGVASALLCLEDAQWKDNCSADDQLGVVAGISNSAQDVAETIFEVVHEHGYRRTLPYFLTKAVPHSTASETGLITGFQKEVMTFSTACTAGFNAISFAYDRICTGQTDAYLCVSTDATITECTLACFCRSNLLSTRNDDPERASRPFDATRDGGVLGEGSGTLLLEDLNHALYRGAHIYAEILGAGSSGTGYSNDAADTTATGMADAMRKAMQSANCGPATIDYIGCHGVSDPNLDAWETEAIKAAFGPRAYQIPMSSIKGLIGIPQNAAAALQLVATVLGMQRDIVLPTAHYEQADPRCDLDYVPNKARRNRIERALILSHGFNGSDAALILGRPNLL